MPLAVFAPQKENSVNVVNNRPILQNKRPVQFFPVQVLLILKRALNPTQDFAVRLNGEINYFLEITWKPDARKVHYEYDFYRLTKFLLDEEIQIQRLNSITYFSLPHFHQ